MTTADRRKFHLLLFKLWLTKGNTLEAKRRQECKLEAFAFSRKEKPTAAFNHLLQPSDDLLTNPVD